MCIKDMNSYKIHKTSLGKGDKCSSYVNGFSVRCRTNRHQIKPKGTVPVWAGISQGSLPSQEGNRFL